jgi:hypothetical protein
MHTAKDSMRKKSMTDTRKIHPPPDSQRAVWTKRCVYNYMYISICIYVYNKYKYV